jgi:hypothetical protein
MLTQQDRQMMEELGADSTIHIVRLAYAGRDWNMASKDVNFASGSVMWRWEQGYQDGLRAIALGKGCPFPRARPASWCMTFPAAIPTTVRRKRPNVRLDRPQSRCWCGVANFHAADYFLCAAQITLDFTKEVHKIRIVAAHKS